MDIACRTLSQAENVTKLSFSDNHVGCVGTAALVGMLTKAHCRTLSFLNLSHNIIRDEGAQHLGSLLSESQVDAAPSSMVPLGWYADVSLNVFIDRF